MIAAAIPCLNEGHYIGSVVLQAKKYVDKVLVINDGSDDNTAEVAELAGATVLSHSRNRGKGTAIKTAFTWARNNDVKTLILLDGDGQHNPADIPDMLKPIQDGNADMVVGSRFLQQNDIPLYRRLGQIVLNFVTNLGSRTKLTDSQSGFRAFSAKAIQTISFREKGLSIESEMQLVASQQNLKIAEVPIEVKYLDSAGRNPVSHGFEVLSRVLTLFILQRPLFLFGLPGLLLLCSGIGMGGYTISVYNSAHVLAVGYSLGTVLLAVSGLLLLFLSLMLKSMQELLAR